ncbi:GntR family transcriptional regulator [Bifidobacterium sp. DSM 109958]|uniref:GntR family transcriptional regulator n=1 Tax=Bifidobacterium moraviense TaxID=2675323 RepID=A0A7Y0F2S2_9BIFI|nr:GntR family transcriptional regulator [Bifidobacterium sp. DSM 109958]NMN00974.1 GntR family transcriptional regulator [Bifidobacterium sp. DSM 109958]
MANTKLSDRLYERIKQDILFLRLEPGEAVSMQKLSDMYGGSRTPVREAVVRLEQEGLLIVHPQSKTEVSPISVSRVEQERFVRTALEDAAVDDFIRKCNQLAVDTMDHINHIFARAIEREDYKSMFDVDNRFHRLIFEVAGRMLAYDLSSSASSHDMRMRYLGLAMGHQGPNVLAEHRAIAEAARDLDGERMRLLLREHLGYWSRALGTLRAACPDGYFVD